MVVQSSRPRGGRWETWAGVGTAPAGLDAGGDWARWGEGQRCVGRGSEEGCGSSEWTGVRVPKVRRPVGREGSRNSPLEDPIALWSELGTTSLCIPRHCSEPKESLFGIRLEGVFRNPSTGGRKKVPGPDSPPVFSLPTPIFSSKGAED